MPLARISSPATTSTFTNYTFTKATTAESGRKQEWLVPRRPPVEAYELLSPAQQRRVDRYPEAERAAAAWLLLIDSGPEWRARATPCRNCAGQRWPCVDPVSPGQRRRCEGCYRSGWVCNDPTPLWAVPAAPPTPRASASTPNAPVGRAPAPAAPVGRAPAPATPVFRPSTATTILDLTSTSNLGRRQRRASSRDAESAEVTVATDREAELFFASRSTEEGSDANSDSEDDIEFLGMSETPVSAQPPKKRPRNTSPRPDLLATHAAGPSTARSPPRATLVVNCSTKFTIYVARDILKAAEQTAPSDVAVSWPGRPPPGPDVAHTVMVHDRGKSINIAVWDHRGRTVNYIHETGSTVNEAVKEEVLLLGRARNLYKAEDGITLATCAARRRPPNVTPGMWASVMAVWFTRNHGVQECLKLLDQFQIRPAHVCDDLNAILRGEHWSGQCFELQGRPRTSRTAAQAPQRKEPASVATGSAQMAETTSTSPASVPHVPLPPPPSSFPNITETTAFTPGLVRRILASAQKIAQGSTLSFNGEMMAADTAQVILVTNVGSSWSIAVWRSNPRDLHYIYAPGSSNTKDDEVNIAQVLERRGIQQKRSDWVTIRCPLVEGVAGGLWVSVMAVWLSSHKKLGKRLKSVPRFVVRQEGFARYLNAVLGGKRGQPGIGFGHVQSQVKEEPGAPAGSQSAAQPGASNPVSTATVEAQSSDTRAHRPTIKMESSTLVPSAQSSGPSALGSTSSIFEYTPPPMRR